MRVLRTEEMGAGLQKRRRNCAAAFPAVHQTVISIFFDALDIQYKNGYASAWYYGGIDRELAAAGKIVTLVYFFFALPGALFQNGKRFIQTCRVDADHNRDAAPFQKSSAGMKQRYKKACLV